MDPLWEWLLKNVPAIAISLIWALAERRERKLTQERYLTLSERCTHLISAHTLDVAERERRHSRERVEQEKQHSALLCRREEQHMLQLDSSQRTALGHFESLFEKISKAFPNVVPSATMTSTTMASSTAQKPPPLPPPPVKQPVKPPSSE